MRCFLAVDLDQLLRAGVKTLQTKLPKGLRLADPESFHFTLKFLGDIDDSQKNSVMMVSNIKLKRSKLTKDGPVYEDLKIFELG